MKFEIQSRLWGATTRYRIVFADNKATGWHGSRADALTAASELLRPKAKKPKNPKKSKKAKKKSK